MLLQANYFEFGISDHYIYKIIDMADILKFYTDSLAILKCFTGSLDILKFYADFFQIDRDNTVGTSPTKLT